MSAPFVDLDREGSLLAMCISHNRKVLKAAEFVEAKDFYDQRHAIIFGDLRDAVLAGSPANTLTLADTLSQKWSNLTRAEAYDFIAGLGSKDDSYAMDHWITRYAKEIARDGKARRMLQRFDKMARASEWLTAEEYLEEVKAFDIGDQDGGDKSGRWFSEIVQSLQDAQSGLKPRSRIHATGIPLVDRNLRGGLRDGSFVVVGGMPGSGKSALVGQWAVNISQSGAGAVLLATLEMDGEQTATRLLSTASNCDAEHIESGLADDWDGIMKMYAKLPIYVMDTPPFTIDDILIRAKLLKPSHGLSMVAIDFLHLLDGPGKDALERLTYITRRCKLMAAELKCPVVLLSSFNRTAFDGGKPSMRNFRGSGSIESDASIMFVVHRDHVIDPSQDPHLCFLHKLKDRHVGMLDTLELRYIGEQLRFEGA